MGSHSFFIYIVTCCVLFPITEVHSGAVLPGVLLAWLTYTVGLVSTTLHFLKGVVHTLVHTRGGDEEGERGKGRGGKGEGRKGRGGGGRGSREGEGTGEGVGRGRGGGKAVRK